MDFKALINKIGELDDKISSVPAPQLPKAVQLNEDAQLRVLAGTSSYISEAKKKAEEKKEDKEEVKEEMKVGDKKPSSTGGTIEKTKTGIKHHAGKNYGGDKAPNVSDDEDAPKKKAKKESIDPVAFKSKFSKMVEAKKADDKKKAKKEKMEEGSKPDFLDLDKDGNKKEPMKSAAKSKGGDKKDDKKGMSAKQAKFFGKKKAVKESIEQKLTFKQMIQLVRESGGQQQIDPVDSELFAWATRIAQRKFNESAKQEVYAGLVYERMGGVFEMYDVLSEAQK